MSPYFLALNMCPFLQRFNPIFLPPSPMPCSILPNLQHCICYVYNVTCLNLHGTHKLHVQKRALVFLLDPCAVLGINVVDIPSVIRIVEHRVLLGYHVCHRGAGQVDVHIVLSVALSYDERRLALQAPLKQHASLLVQQYKACDFFSIAVQTVRFCRTIRFRRFAGAVFASFPSHFYDIAVCVLRRLLSLSSNYLYKAEDALSHKQAKRQKYR